MIKIFIIDDHQIIIDAISNYLESVPDIELLGSTVAAIDGIEQVKQLKPDVVLLDISMPEMDGIACASKILKQDDQQKIIILSTHQEVSIIKKLMKIGVHGYISKATGINSLEEAIKMVVQGEKYLGNHVAKAYMNALINPQQRDRSLSVIPKLTDREKQVLKLIAKEATTQEIGQALFISPNTVETHRRNLIDKFQVRNSIGLIKKAMEFGMLN